MKIDQTYAVITGRPAVFAIGPIIKPAIAGRTTLQIKGARLIETTETLSGSYQREILLADVDGAALVQRPNALLLTLGILTLWILGLGVVFIVLGYVFKERYLIVTSARHRVAITVKGDTRPFRRFMDAVLRLAAAAQDSTATA